ncbi:hypothetical protein [Geobacter sp.]|uniref:hypothetical protein n=1 Tax=Geobacter sp. TaxID=46610 RepID=UPI001AC06DAC|nr:hypothetical protein [Geobacter sp.]CAG0942186.1 hypothetical protein BROC_01758 [Candidatus Brocadiaceae bacterium]
MSARYFKLNAKFYRVLLLDTSGMMADFLVEGYRKMANKVYRNDKCPRNKSDGIQDGEFGLWFSISDNSLVDVGYSNSRQRVFDVQRIKGP